MLVTAKDVLNVARKNHYAVPGFNCVEDIMVRAILDTAEECKAPVFLMCYSEELEGRTWVYLPGLIKAVASDYDIPIVLHLDHATDLDMIQRTLDCGFTSVMYDGSSLPFEKNAEITRKVVEMAKPYGASVEAELGLVGGFNLNRTGSVANVLTEPEEVVKFVELTGVDSLAVSIGTAHGVYSQLPNLDIERLKKLNEVSPVPLVLHGGSGTPNDQIQAAVRNGICKLNIYADSRIALWKSIKSIEPKMTREDPLPKEIFRIFREDLSVSIREKFELLYAVHPVLK
ncbi:MAG: class II fructose-bisphosphate aldolase [Thermoguttaceae bacterium]